MNSIECCHSHGKGFLVLICELGCHLQVTMATVIRTTGLLDVDLMKDMQRHEMVGWV